MKVPTFRKKLAKIINADYQFMAEDNRERWYKGMGEDELVVVGDSHRQVFVLKIIKVYDDNKKAKIINKEGKLV